MGEEEKKKPEEKKDESTKKPVQEKEKKVAEDAKNPEPEKGESKENASKDPPPPPPPPLPQEIILRVYMHCEGCARKVRRCLKGFDGVEKVETDCKGSKVVVRGEKADPLKVLERIQRKSHRKVELLSPIPKPPAAAEEPKKAEPIQIETKKEEEIQVVTVVLMVHMHCEACAQEIRRQIQKMKGVESAMPDLKSSEVVVKGSFKPPELINFIHKRTGKQAVIIKVEPPENQAVEENAKKDTDKEDKKDGGGGGGGEKDSKKGEKEPKDEKTEPLARAAEAAGDKGDAKEAEKNDDPSKQEMKKSELMYNYPQNYHQVYNPNIFIHQEYGAHAYPPQIFSDENPNSCTVM